MLLFVFCLSIEIVRPESREEVLDLEIDLDICDLSYLSLIADLDSGDVIS